MEDIIIPKNQISVANDVVTVESPELIEGLIKKNEEGLKNLETIGVKVDEISISKTGKLEFSSKDFAEKIKKELERFPKDELVNAICLLNTATCLPNTIKKCSDIPLTKICDLPNLKICDLPNLKITCIPMTPKTCIPMTPKTCMPKDNILCKILPGIPYPGNINPIIKK